MRPSLDPFVFPSETRGWFRILLAAAILIALNVGFLVENRLHPAPGWEASGATDSRGTAASKDTDVGWGSISRHGASLAIPSLFGLFLLALASVIYRFHPARQRRHLKSQALAASDAPQVAGYLQRCAQNLGLRPLRLEFKAAGFANNAETFGLRGQEYIVLHGGPAQWRDAWGDIPKAVALHEIGHIVNRDAQEREKCFAVWAALLVLVVPAYGWLAILSILKPHPATALIDESLWSVGWRLAAMLLVIRIVFAGMVMAREYYADQRVASWGLGRALRERLKGEESERSGSEAQAAGWRRVRERIGWIGSRHPSATLRLKALEDPLRLFRVPSGLAFLAGLLLAMLLANLYLPIQRITHAFSLMYADTFWPAHISKEILFRSRLMASLNMDGVILLSALSLIAIAYLWVDLLGGQVQREVIADLARGERKTWGYGRLWLPALLLSLGFEVGLAIVPFRPLDLISFSPGLTIFWLVGWTCLNWLWLASVRAGARFTLGFSTGPFPPRGLFNFAQTSALVLLIALYSPALFGRMSQSLWREIPPGANPQEFFTYFYVGSLAVLLVIAVLVFVVWALSSVAFMAWRLFRSLSCSRCGAPIETGLTLGRSCGHCRSPLAAWAYAGAPRDPGLVVGAVGAAS